MAKSTEEIKIAQLTGMLDNTRDAYHKILNLIDKNQHTAPDWKQCNDGTCATFKKVCAELGIDI